VPDSGWDYGTNLGYLKNLVAYWDDAFDRREQERRSGSGPHQAIALRRSDATAANHC
jgi:microsomal epoxide hydrolase